ncbi:enolase-phosphatase E1 [Nothobranchius furzeri]
MDPTEDLSARVLLKRILSTQSPQTPVTRSQSQEVSTSGLRRSSRQSRRRDAETKTPQDILRRSLRQNIRESIARKSQPPTDRRTVSVMLSRVPSSTSMLLSDVATPRHLLRNILQTDPVKSPVVHKTEPPKEPEPQSAEETTRTHPSTELSELELPDITIGNIGSVAKGLSRKRPCRSLNVTAFEKRLKAVKDVEEGVEDASYDHSSLSLSSSTSLTLKTPFADVETEKRGLQRKVSNRRKVSEEDFGAAVSKRQMGDVSSHGFMEGNLSEVTNFEGFTLGPSKLGEADIMNCNTALYDLPDAMVSGFSVVATEDKHSGMSSQLQDVVDAEQEEELGEMAKDTADMFPSEEKDAASSEVDENASDVLMQEDVAEFQAEQSKANVADDAEVMSTSEEEEAAAESETDDGAECEEVEAQTGEKRVSDDDFTEEEEAAAESETDDGAECEEVEAQTGEKRVSDDDFTEEEEAAAESETDDGAECEEVEAQTGEKRVSDDGFTEEEEAAAESETDDGAECEEVEAQTGEKRVSDDGFTEEEEAAAESETDDGAECEEVEAQTGEKRVSDDDFTEEEEAAAESETDDGAECEEVEAQTGEKRVSDDDFTEEEEAAAESETGKTDDGAEEVEAQTGEEGASGDDLTEEEEVSPDSQTEEEQGVAETQEHVPDSQSEDIESFLSEEEEDAQDPLPEHAVASVPFQGDDEDEAQSEDEEDVATSQTEDDNDEQREEEDQALEHMEQDSSHISRRARRSEGVPVVPVPEVREDAAEASEAGWSKAHTSTGVNASAEVENHARRRTRTGSSASSKLSVQDEGDVFDTENVPASGTKASFPCLELTQDIQVDEHRSNDSSEEDAGQEDECDDDLDEEEDLPCKTPAFVKEKKIFLSDPAASPFVFKNVPTSGTSTGLPAAKPKQVRPRKTRTASKKGVLPKSYLLSTFRHFAKTKVSADVYPILNEIMDKFFDRMAEDLETYAAHANRKTIEFEDAVLLLKRQGHVNENMPVEVLIEKYLRMDQRKILIPIATSGNVVIPKMR